jgi:hypothetical protein
MTERDGELITMPGRNGKRQNEKIRKAWAFLIKHAEDGQPFSIDELSAASGWASSTMNIDLSKKLSELVHQKGTQFFASPAILRVRYGEFEDLFYQKRLLFAEYSADSPKVNGDVLVYEFFMPLTREDRLREALDNLFYRDAVEQRFREIVYETGLEHIREELQLDRKLAEEDVRQFVVQFIAETIGGYSLSVVSGRFRASDSLATRKEAAARSPSDGPYLVDETTAVVRFILPVDVGTTPIQRKLGETVPTVINTAVRAEQMRWVFLNFFAQAVTRVVRQEDEIWLLETGMANKLYRWVKRDE